MARDGWLAGRRDARDGADRSLLWPKQNKNDSSQYLVHCANNEQCISLHYFICQCSDGRAQKAKIYSKRKKKQSENSKQEEKKKLRRIGENRLDHVYVVHNRAQSSLCLSLTFCVWLSAFCSSYRPSSWPHSPS